MKNLTKVIFHISLLSSFILLSACSVQRSSPQPHEKAKELVVMAPRIEEPDMQKLSEKAKKFNSYWAIARNPKSTPQDLYQKVIAELAPFILTGDYVQNQEFVEKPELTDLLAAFNQAFLNLLKKNRALAESKNLIAQYRTMIFSHCYDGLKGCHPISFKFFQSNSKTGEIIVEIALPLSQQIKATRPNAQSTNTDKIEYINLTANFFQYLQMAFDISFAQKDPRIQRLYLEHAVDYARMFELNDPDFRLTYEAKRNSDLYSYYFSNLGKSNLSIKDRQAFCSTVFAMNPVAKSNRDLNAFGNQQSKKGLVNEFISCQNDKRIKKEKTQINDYISEFLQNQRDQFNLTHLDKNGKFELHTDADSEKSDPSYLFQVKYLEKKRPAVIKSLKLRTDIPESLSFYVTDRLFYDHISIEEATLYWNSDKIKQADLLALARQYVQIQIAFLVVKTNEALSQYLSDPKNYTSSTMFTGAITAVTELARNWKTTTDRIASLHNFLTGNFGSKYTYPDLKDMNYRDYDQTTKMLRQIKTTINYVSVWPIMTMLSYLMSQKNGTVTFYIYWLDYTFTDTANVIIRNLLNGLLDTPWFKHGDSTAKLNNIDFLYSFFFTLQTETFKTFKEALEASQSTDFNLNEEIFLNEFVKSFLGKDVTSIISFTSTNLRSALNNSQQYLQMCEGTAYPSYTLLEKVSKYAGIYSANADALGFRLYSEPWSTGATIDKKNVDFVLRYARTELESRYTLINTLRDILYDFLKNSSSSQFQNTKAIIDTKFEDHLAIRRTFYRTLLEAYTTIGNCNLKLNIRENETRFAVFEKERQYILLVHKSMAILNLAEKLSDNNHSISLQALRQEISNNQSIASFTHNFKSWQVDTLRLLNSAISQFTSDLIPVKSLELLLNQALAVHNNRDRQDVGYFASFAPDSTQLEENIFRDTGTRSNSFNAKSFNYFQWDLYLRIGIYLQDLIPNLTIGFPKTAEALQQLSLFKSSASKPFSWIADENLFLTAVIKELDGTPTSGSSKWISWFSKDTLYADLDSQLKTMIQLMRQDWIDVSDHACTPSNQNPNNMNHPIVIDGRRFDQKQIRKEGGLWKYQDGDCEYWKLPAEEVVSFTLKWIHFLDLDYKKQFLVQSLDMTSLYSTTNLASLFLKTGTTEPADNFFDLMYNDYVTSESIEDLLKLPQYTSRSGDDQSAGDYTNKLGLIEFRSVFRTEQRMLAGALAFNIANSTLEVIHQNYRSPAERYFRIASEFENAVRTLELRSKNLPEAKVTENWNVNQNLPRLIYSEVLKGSTISENGWLVMRPQLYRQSGNMQSAPMLLDPEKTEDFVEFERRYTTDTGCILLDQLDIVKKASTYLDKQNVCGQAFDSLEKNVWTRFNNTSK